MQGKRKFDKGRDGTDRSYSQKQESPRGQGCVGESERPFQRSQYDAPAELKRRAVTMQGKRKFDKARDGTERSYSREQEKEV